MAALARLLLLALLLCALAAQGARAQRRRVHIPDKLDDVVDDEEDEEWKEWGKKRPKAAPFKDLNKMDPMEAMREAQRSRQGAAMGFAKLRYDPDRPAEEASKIAARWTELLKTGSVISRIYAVDGNTILLHMDSYADVPDVKQFVLSRDEAYEFKANEKTYRRPGDPPLEQITADIQRQEEERRKSLEAERKAERRAKKVEEERRQRQAEDEAEGRAGGGGVDAPIADEL